MSDNTSTIPVSMATTSIFHEVHLFGWVTRPHYSQSPGWKHNLVFRVEGREGACNLLSQTLVVAASKHETNARKRQPKMSLVNHHLSNNNRSTSEMHTFMSTLCLLTGDFNITVVMRFVYLYTLPIHWQFPLFRAF